MFLRLIEAIKAVFQIAGLLVYSIFHPNDRFE